MTIALFLALPAAAESAAWPVQPQSALFHGNWCGVGDAGRAAPEDALDAACRAHDICYERMGRNACPCNNEFLKATAAIVRNPRTEETLRNKAAAANSLFSTAPCVDPEERTGSSRRR
ncbi:phospholipase A2 family protein [Microvirga roseola]|uniref:phospholipase A2 family protein n=1 Tax=Microvirga roseola TaxID=2883126 RepID=UPI001E4815B4|nr:phospholipase A2 family protein [Microvirga roseola]